MEHEDIDAKQLVMASKNNSSSIGDGTAPPEKPDVFISFSGDDTGKGFVSHLKASLRRNDLALYSSTDKIPITNYNKAIENCLVAVVVLSMKSSRSARFLDELEKIVECSKKNKQIVVPVFYDVDPSTVRKQTGRYAEAFAKLEQEFKDDLKKVQSWRNAFTEVASFSGWDCTINVRTEHEIVEEITKDVVEKLNRVCVGDLDFQTEKLEKLAQLQQEFLGDIHNSENERNYKATLERIKRLKMEKKFRLLRLPPDLLSHMEISKATNTYF